MQAEKDKIAAEREENAKMLAELQALKEKLSQETVPKKQEAFCEEKGEATDASSDREEKCVDGDGENQGEKE